MRTSFWSLFMVLSSLIYAQDKQCNLKIGTNLSGLSDWMTEMPFVDMMHHARIWGTRNIDWSGEWNSELSNLLETDENGYPLEVPFDAGVGKEQMVFTVWAIIDAWEPGIYTFLYDGEGEILFGSDGEIIKSETGRMEVKIIPSENSFLEMMILESKKGNHLRNFRLIMPGHENSYTENPFNPLFLDRLSDFAAIRFMDWGQTNNWGENNSWENYDESEDTILVPWSKRSQQEYYTWAHNKGIPYEMMCKLSNTLNKDMWVCAPHNASNEYIREMAKLIKENLKPELKVYAEYSNEVWNWMFGQTQWLNTFFCEGRGLTWPEGIVDHIQNNLNIWNEIFLDERDRLITVAGGQTSWQDVTNRIVLNLEPGSFDALNITGYFALSDEGDEALDALGSLAKSADVAYWVRKHMYAEEIHFIETQYELAKQLNIPIVFYEAGQHITPHPFGEEPSYAQSLLDIQRDTAIYNLYHEWYNLLEDILKDGDQSLYMNFSFVGKRSAQYGSWGILETLNQDTSVIYAPKFKATIEHIYNCGNPLVGIDASNFSSKTIAPKLINNGLNNFLLIGKKSIKSFSLYSIDGSFVEKFEVNINIQNFNLCDIKKGIYLVSFEGDQYQQTQKIKVY